MSSTTFALTKDERSALRRTASTFEAPPGYYEGMNPRQYVDFMLLTGCHPSVLADAVGHNLRISRDRADKWSVHWDRPKKRGAAAATMMSFSPTEHPWVPAFVDSVKLEPRSTRQIQLFIGAIGKAAQIQGAVSPRTLRHTCAIMLAEAGKTWTYIRDRMNVSDRTLHAYMKLTEEQAEQTPPGHLSAVP